MIGKIGLLLETEAETIAGRDAAVIKAAIRRIASDRRKDSGIGLRPAEAETDDDVERDHVAAVGKELGTRIAAALHGLRHSAEFAEAVAKRRIHLEHVPARRIPPCRIKFSMARIERRFSPVASGPS